MRQIKLIIFLMLIATISLGQICSFELKNIKFRGLDFTIEKEIITKTFGPGERIETNYECGDFTNDQKNGPYYQLVYDYFIYIGCDNEKFLLQQVNFDIKGKAKIIYLNKELNGQTTRDDFFKFFEIQANEYFKKHPDKNSILLLSKGSDAGAIFSFKDNKLIKFEYWSPC